MVLAVVVGLWVARYLGPEGYGQLNYALAAVALLGPLAELGFEAVLRREFVRNPETSAKLAGTATRLRLVGALLAVGVVTAYAFFPGVITGDRRLLLILSLSLFQPGAMVAESWLQSRLESRKSVIPQWIALGLGAGLRILAIVMQAPIEAFAAIIIIELGLSTILVVRSARRSGLRIGRADGAMAVDLLKECWPLALASVSVMIYMRIDVLMLRWMVGDGAAGNYSAAVRLSELAYYLPMIAAASVQPMLVRAHQEGNAVYLRRLQGYFDLSAVSAYAVAFPMALLSSHLIAWAYGPLYASAAPVLAVHAWASVFVFLGVARSQHLINVGYTRFSLMSTLAGALANVVLNLVFIPRWSGTGAALATVLAQAIAAWGMTLCYAPTLPIAILQTRSILIPITWYRYVRKN